MALPRVALVRAALLSTALFLLTSWASASEEAAATTTASADAFTRALSQGPVYAALAALVGGFLVSLTPCVYPMAAVTVSAFGANRSRGRLHSVGLSSAFVGGIIAMFTPLGVVAGLTGSVFGSVLQSTWVVVGISVLFLGMAASMFGAFELSLPSSVVQRLSEIGGLGVRGAFGLGMVCGLIAAPCTGPVLTGILTWIAQTQSAGLGALAMFAFSLGLGAPFFALGAFAVHLPKSGAWMVHVKSILGIVLSVVALYFLSTAFPIMTGFAQRNAPFFIGAAVTILVGLGLGAVHREFASERYGDRILKGLGIVLCVGGAFALVSAVTLPERTLSWEKATLAEAREKAASQNRPLLVDFTAAWCIACKEMDAVTFAEPDVAREAGRFVAVKVDATDDEDPAVQRAMASLNVKGLPTVVLFDSEGNEARRYTDFVPPEKFLPDIQAVP